MRENVNPKGVLVLCEYTSGGIHHVAYELMKKGSEIAEKLNQPLNCLLLAPEGTDTTPLEERGADTVYFIQGECFDVPNELIYKENILPFVSENMPMVMLVGATEFGRSLAPRLACALETGLTADCTDLDVNEEGEFIQIRPAFSDNILAHIHTLTFPKIATVRYKEFSEAEREIGRKAKVERIPPCVTEYDGYKITEILPIKEKDITEAEVIVAAGRGVKTAEDMKLIEEFAEAVNGTVGVSRALVDMGIASSNIQIGYSGHRVKPKIYIACGISGAPQHIAGMKESELIISINKDPSAPIFGISDYGFVGDLYEVIPKLIKKIKEEK